MMTDVSSNIKVVNVSKYSLMTDVSDVPHKLIIANNIIIVDSGSKLINAMLSDVSK